MGKKSQVGSSPFTHQDDLGAELHPSNPEHTEALLHGGPVTPKEELEEVVLGPGAFGSPDPQTLGHVMMPAVEGSPSAAKLAPEFSHLQEQGTYAGQADEEQLNEMTKEELSNYADQRGVEYNSSATKDELIDSILDHQDSSEAAAEEDTPDYESMSKAELLDEAKSKGISDVSESNTKQEILDALSNA
jgi:Rho termination factor-like protein